MRIRSAVLWLAVVLPGAGLLIIVAHADSGMLERWQTLITGLMAIGGAILSVNAIRTQIRSDQDLEHERVRRRYMAARSALPHWLKEVTEYSERCGVWLTDVLKSADEELIPHGEKPAVPAYSPELIQVLKDTIEVSNPDVAGALSKLLAALQIQASRTRDLRKRLLADESQIVVRTNILRAIADTASIRARANALFNFARGRADQVSNDLSQEQVFEALAELSHVFGEDDELSKLVKRSHDMGI